VEVTSVSCGVVGDGHLASVLQPELANNDVVDRGRYLEEQTAILTNGYFAPSLVLL
jgi:hypothetical protein